MPFYGSSSYPFGRVRAHPMSQPRFVLHVPEPPQPPSSRCPQRAGPAEFVSVSSLTYPDAVFPDDVGMPPDFACMIW